MTWIKAKKTLLMHAIDKKSSEFDLKQKTLSSLRLLLGAAFRADSPLRLRRARGVAGSSSSATGSYASPAAAAQCLALDGRDQLDGPHLTQASPVLL